MIRYPKEVVLKDGQDANIRAVEAADEAALRQFYTNVPEADRWYMKADPMQPDTIKNWMRSQEAGGLFAIVAVAGEQIVAHARLLMRTFGATRHVGRLRIMVAPAYRHKRLGTWMLLDLIRLAMDKGLRDLRSDFVVGIEDAAIEAAHKLDFFKTALFPEYIRDPQGRRHDLQIMIKRLHKDWSDF